MWFHGEPKARVAHRGAEALGAGAGGPSQRTAPGPGRSSGLRGAGQLRGLSALAALLASAPQDILAASPHQSSFLWTLGVVCLRAWGIQLTFPGCQGQNEPGWAPNPALAPALLGAFCLGVCGECFCVLAPRRPGFPPRVCPPGDPSGRDFPSACGAQRLEWGTRVGRAGRASPGKLADGGECWAGCLQRALSRARSRCRCCPCLRGRLAGLWST